MKIKKSLFVCSLLLGAMNLSAYSYNAEDFSVEKGRKVFVINKMRDVNYLTTLIVHYINETLDTSPTRAKIEDHFNKKNQDIWKNYRNQNCTETSDNCDDNITNGIGFVFDKTNERIEFQNVMGDILTLSPKELETYEKYNSFNGVGQLSPDKNSIYFDFLNFPSLENTLLTLEECDSNPKLQCSVSEPTDTTLYWKKPKGNGEFDTWHYDDANTKWINKSQLSSLKSETLLYDKSEFDKNNTPGSKGEKVLVKENGKYKEYIHDGDKWINTAGGSDMPSVTASIDPLLNRGSTTAQWYDSDVDTEISVTNLFSNSSVTFKRETNYWKSISKVNVPSYNTTGYVSQYIYLTHDISLLPSEDTNAVAYSTQNNNGAGFTGDNQKFEFFYDGSKWQNTVYTLENLLLSANKNLQDGSYWVMEKKSIFNNQGYAVDSTTNTFEFWLEDLGGDPGFISITRGDRTDMSPPTDDKRINITYILGNEPTYSPDGLNSSYVKEDNSRMKYWLFTDADAAIKKVNNMTDHEGVCSSLSQCYSSNKKVALFQDNLIVLTDTEYWQKPDGTNYPKCGPKTGFVWIPNTDPAMCVAKYEMTPFDTSGWGRQYDAYRNDSKGPNTYVTSRAGQNPISYVSTLDARSMCASSLVDHDSNLMSGATSMKFDTHRDILKDLATNPKNWSGGAVGNGYIYSGHNDNSPSSSLATPIDDSDGYYGTGNSSNSGANQKRNLKFSNGEEVYDYTGNIWEQMYETQNIGGSNGWEEYTDGNTNPFNPKEFINNSYNWYSIHGIGKKVHHGAGNATYSNIGSGSYWLLYGGRWNHGSGAGLFASHWDAHSTSYHNGTVGFRCIKPAE